MSPAPEIHAGDLLFWIPESLSLKSMKTPRLPKSKQPPNSSPPVQWVYIKTWIIVAVLLLLFAAQNIVEMRRQSCTSDELIKLTAGYTYWLKGDFRLNRLHPPLLKMYSALPLLILRPKIDFSDPSWIGPVNQWKFSADFLYSDPPPRAGQILFWARLPVVLLTTLLGFFIFRWAQQLYGDLSGIFALALFSFSPNFLAHSHWVSLDAGTTALMIISLYLLWQFARSGKKPTLLWSALTMGAALGSKYLAFAMLPGYAILLGIIPRSGFFPNVASPSPPPSKNDRKSGQKPGARRDPHENPETLLDGFKRTRALTLVLLIGTLVVGVISLLGYFNLVHLGDYLIGLSQVRNYKRSTFPFYLHGAFQEGGAWYFFPVTFLIKATGPFLLLVAHRFLVFFRHWKMEWRDSIFLAIPAIIYFILVSTFANPIGIRYLLPVFALLMVFSSKLVSCFARHKVVFWVLWILLGWHISSSLIVFPSHLSYLNEFAGGASHGTDWLDDSNVDWGQDLKSLKETLDKQGIENVTLLSFSPYDNPQYYGIHCVRPPQEEWLAIFRNPQPGFYAISAHWLARAKGLGFDWKLRYPVVADVGNSMFVFEIR